jgi:hypothetical protein
MNYIPKLTFPYLEDYGQKSQNKPRMNYMPKLTFPYLEDYGQKSQNITEGSQRAKHD